MLIEVGKAYRTRNGKRVYIVGQTEKDGDYPFVGFIQGTDHARRWREHGSYANTPNSDYDLMCPWIEPHLRMMAWLSLNSNTGQLLRFFPEGSEPMPSHSDGLVWQRAPWLDQPAGGTTDA